MMQVYVDASPKQTAFVAIGEASGFIRREVTPIPEPTTSNQAEYMAVLRALTAFKSDIEIVSDSQLMVRQLNGEYAVRNPGLRELAARVWKVAEGRKVKFVWVPREQNLAGKMLG